MHPWATANPDMHPGSSIEKLFAMELVELLLLLRLLFDLSRFDTDCLRELNLHFRELEFFIGSFHC